MDIPPLPDDAFDNLVTFHARPQAETDGEGDDVYPPKADWPGVEMMASVQPMAPNYSEPDTIERTSGLHLVYTATDPGVGAGGEVRWGTKTLTVEGPAADQGGYGVCWVTTTKEYL